jgi:hypothetical protein
MGIRGNNQSIYEHVFTNLSLDILQRVMDIEI